MYQLQLDFKLKCWKDYIRSAQEIIINFNLTCNQLKKCNIKILELLNDFILKYWRDNVRFAQKIIKVSFGEGVSSVRSPCSGHNIYWIPTSCLLEWNLIEGPVCPQ